MRRLACCLLAVLLFSACAEEVDGPEPKMADSPDDLATSPSFVCNEAHGDDGTWVTVTGEDFSSLVVDAIATDKDHDVELPQIVLTHRLDPTGETEIDDGDRIELDSPLGADYGQVRWIDGETLKFKVTDDLELAPGVYDITVINPDGKQSTEHDAVGVLPRPELEAAIPELTCVAQGDRDLTLEGENILVGDDNHPTVRIGDQTYDVDAVDGCQSLHPVYAGHEVCDEAELTVDEASLEADTYDVILENIAPADCPSRPDEDGVVFTVADPPEVHEVQPTPICSEQLDYEAVEIDGQGFVTLGDGEDLPEVTIGSQTYQPESADDCTTIDEAPAMGAEECTQLTVFIAADDLAGDVDDDEFVTDVDVTVENPDPVGCHSTDDATVGVTPPPSIAAVAPRAACNNDGTITFDVDGDHFLEIDDETPQIVVDDQEYDTDVAECTDIESEDGVRGCESLTVDIDLEDAGLEGGYAMRAINPEPANCESADSEEFYAAGPPNITGADPDGFCLDDGDTFDGELALDGQFLYDPDEGVEPTVEVDGQQVDIDEMVACASALDDEHGLQLCGGIDTSIPDDLADDLEDEDFTVTVTAPTSPDGISCGSDTITLEHVESPTIDSVVPTRVCSAGSSVTVNGTDLHPDAEANLDGQPADDVDVDANGQTATVTFDGPLSTGEATFEFVNPGNCGTEYTEEDLRITDGPEPIFVDPPVVFNQMNTQVTIYGAGLFGGSIDQVELVHPDGETTDLEFDVDDDRANVVQAEIPENMLDDVDDADFNDGEDAADFGIRLTDQEITCSNENDALVTITDETTLALESIEPPFGGTTTDTAVEIFADADPDDGDTNFASTPRAYLNPTGDDDALGQEIRAIQFLDETQLTGIVASGLSVGIYDLIVVNPGGEVGVLDDAFEVTEHPAPIVESVSPSTWVNEAGVEVDVEGENFRDDLDVDVFCRATGDDETDEDELDNPNSIAIGEVTETSIELTVDAGNLDEQSACYMRVTNTDGTYGEYSPITVTNPSNKFLEFQTSADFETPRRAPMALSGAPTRTNRYLYVVGGDDGDTDNAHTSGEFARIDRFGEPGEWSDLPNDLPSGRSFTHGERIDDFVYIVGGLDDGQVTDEILRARVLDPTDVPEIVDVDIEVEQIFEEGQDDADGLDAGTYYYRVAAVYADSDPANPGGESLASEPQPLTLPLDGTSVTISWAFPDQTNHQIEEYRVYRNVEPNDAYGDETLIATVSDTSFTDEGDITPGSDTDDEQPLPLGSLGTWHNIADLEVERRDAGITLAPPPEFDDEYLLYAVGGEDAEGERLATYEWASITVDGPRQQSMTDGMLGADGDGDDLELPTGRTGPTASAAYGANASSLAGVNPQIFVYGGDTDGGATDIFVTTVGDDGELEDWTNLSAGAQPTSMHSPRLGHAGGIMNNQLVYAGASSDGSAGDDGRHVEVLCGGDCPPADLPSNLSSLADLDIEPRAWMGEIPFRSFWYFTGGIDNADDPTTTVQYSVAGSTP